MTSHYNEFSEDQQLQIALELSLRGMYYLVTIETVLYCMVQNQMILNYLR